mmetsp:Transcript_13039/g.37910  ORF Transcript_13039/g.37910 Transcript_13039/m.37910 type:complete len:287 (-) Transcript_13039:20-880(-)
MAEHQHEAFGVKALGAHNVPGVKVVLPPESHDEARHGGEEQGLVPEPPFEDRVLGLLRNGRVEGHKGQRVEVDVVLELLGSGVVLVVLVAPPRGRHAAADAIQSDLQGSVNGRDSGERIVATLVHEPPAAATDNTKNEHAKGLDNEAVKGHEQVRAQGVHGHDLGHAVCDMAGCRVEVALLFKFLAEGKVVLAESLLAIVPASLHHAGRGRAGRNALEDQLGLLQSAVELNESLRGISAIREELDDGSTWVRKVAHIVETPTNQQLVRLVRLRRTVAPLAHGVPWE